MRYRYSFHFLLAALCVIAGCRPKGESGNAGEVVLYTSVDEPFVRPLIAQFQKQTGITVRLVTDAEATKTAGLAEKMLAEKDHPHADVYWGNEPFHTITLGEQDALVPYRPAAAADIHERWRAAGDLYTAIGLRARMIIVSARPEDRALVAKIKGIRDLADPSLKGRIGISHPGFGTASGQVAALYLLWGDAKTDAFLTSLRDNNVLLLGGNSVVAEQTAAGAIVAGLTDNDDIANAKDGGGKVEGVLPDQDSDGTLLIPTTIALVRSGPNPDAAKKLIDFLSTAAVEKQLVDAHFLAFSVRGPATQVKGMAVDYVKVAHGMHDAVSRSLTILQRR